MSDAMMISILHNLLSMVVMAALRVGMESVRLEELGGNRACMARVIKDTACLLRRPTIRILHRRQIQVPSEVSSPALAVRVASREAWEGTGARGQLNHLNIVSNSQALETQIMLRCLMSLDDRSLAIKVIIRVLVLGRTKGAATTSRVVMAMLPRFTADPVRHLASQVDVQDRLSIRNTKAVELVARAAMVAIPAT